MMPEWRWGRGFAEAELEERLRQLHALPRPHAGDTFAAMDRRGGHRTVASSSVVAREEPGAPGAAFARLRRAMTDYAFSDPRIVVGHFRRDEPLLGRRMLLELRTLSLRVLAGVVVERVLERDEEGRSAYGFRYDTLPGHVEEGAEWFVLEKDHATGEIRFHIEARWRPGSLPTWWMRLGFHVLAPRSQELWHRRAHQRMHAIALRSAARPVAIGRLAHGVDVGFATDRTSPMRALGTAAWIGAMTGVRSLVVPAVLGRHRAARGAAAGDLASGGDRGRMLTPPLAEPLLTLAAALEMLADKAPMLPARTRPLPLLGRLAIASWCAGVVARQGRARPWLPMAVAGGVAALGATAATRLRRIAADAGPWPSTLAGLAEDAFVLAAARRLEGALARGVAEPRAIAPERPAPRPTSARRAPG